ncbi:MAG: hypothetical protein ACR2MP_34110 [Streptosporangiaceae bacterium]
MSELRGPLPPHDDITRLAHLMAGYGGIVQITQDAGTGAYLAVERPSARALNVIVGKTLDELEGKLADEYGPLILEAPPRESDLLPKPKARTDSELAAAREELRRIPPHIPGPFDGEGHEAG